jgi:hypothetical protein
LREFSEPPSVEYDDTIIDNLRAQLDTIAAIQTEFEPHSLAEEDYVVRSGMANLRGTVGIADEQRPSNLLFDTGTKDVFVAARIASHFPFAKRRTVSKKEVELPNGNRMSSDERILLPFSVGDYHGFVEGRVLDMVEYDVIIGEHWMQENGTVLDYWNRKITIRDRKGRTHDVTSSKVSRSINTNTFNAIGREIDPRFESINQRQLNRLLNRQKKNPKKQLLQGHILTVRPKEQKTSELPRIEDERFKLTVQRFAGVFSNDLPEKDPNERRFIHPIDTGDSRPINIPAYPLSQSKLEEQTKQIKYLLERGLIRPSSSPWGFPVLFVKKPHTDPENPEWRMCIDYRMLNARTKKNTYPLPLISDCLQQIGNARYISKIDLTSGYWQVLIAEADIEKTAFNTRGGKYEFVAMPFGLTNAPATFQSIMNEILRPFLDIFCIVYLDDIVIYSDSAEEHEKHLTKVLECLSAHELIAKPKKSIIGAREIEFCGFLVGNGIVKPSPEKTSVIQDWPIPRTVHEVRQFLGLASYYRRFIRGFAKLSCPLTELLKEEIVERRQDKHRSITWTAQCEFAFQTLKQLLCSAPVLIQADSKKPFVLETDASEWAVGCALMQRGEDGLLHPVAFDGRKLQGAELNYPVHEKELLAIKIGLRKFDRWIDNGRTTEVITDHESLKYLQTTRSP